jgi:translation initiation factor 2B subunit (eIF-2B alpha/beta/delta family)
LSKREQDSINKVLDEARDNIKKTATEAKKDISAYAEQFTTLQERVIDSARDIAEGYIELQREMFNSFNHFVWTTPYMENFENRTPTANPEMFSLPRTEVYTNTIRMVQVYTRTVVDNYITTTRLANKAAFSHAELINTSLQQVGNHAKEYSRIGINTVKNFHEAASEVAKIGISAVQQQTTVSTQKDSKKEKD